MRFWIAIFLITFCSAGYSKPSFPIIDAHIHTSFDGAVDPLSGIKDDKAELLKEFQEAGVVGAIAHSYEGKEGVFDLSAQHVMYCYGVGENVDLQDLETGLREKKYGCIKIYLGYVHMFAYDPYYRRIYPLAEKYDVPVVFHTGDTDNPTAKLKYSDPLTVDEVAVDFPNVKFVLAHCGNPWIQSAAEVAYKNPNVYLDGSAFLIGRLKGVPEKQIKKYMIEPLQYIFNYVDDPTKLMFGTDWPLINISEYVKAFKKAIPKKYWRQVFYSNAIRLFKIPGLSP